MDTLNSSGRQAGESIQIEGVDTEQGLFNCNNNMDAYREVLDSFLEDADTNMAEMKRFLEKPAKPWNREELQRFSRAVHAVKGVSAIIGAKTLSKRAADLETAAKAGVISGDFPGFFTDYSAMAKNIQSVLKAKDSSG